MIGGSCFCSTSESANSPGWFLVHSIGMGMGILGLVFFLGAAVGMVGFQIFIPVCMLQVRGIPYPLC